MAKVCTMRINPETKQRLEAHMIRYRRKHPDCEGRVTYDDVMVDLLDEEDKR